jgi:hypothetical protein
MKTVARLLFLIVLAVSADSFGQAKFRRWRANDGGRPIVDFTQQLLATVPTASQCTNTNLTGVTVSRNAVEICQKDDGTYVFIDANKPVVEARGLRVWRAVTNLETSANSMYTGPTGGWGASGPGGWEVDMYQDPGGTAPAFGVYVTTTLAGQYIFSPSPFAINSTSAVLSIWCDFTSGPGSVVQLYDITAGAARCSISKTFGAAPTMDARDSCSSTGIVSGNSHEIRIYPGGLAGVGAVECGWPQVEAGRTTKSPYSYEGTTPANNITWAVSDINTAGCSMATVTLVGYQGGVARVINATGGSPISINSATQISMHDNANSATANVSDLSSATTSIRTSWGSSVLSISSGAASGTGVFDGTMGSGDLTIGSASGSSAFLDGWVKNIKISTDKRGCKP